MNTRLIILLLLLFCGSDAYCQVHFGYNKRINGYWGNWEEAYTYYPYTGHFVDYYEAQGNCGNFVIHKSGDHPSNYIMKVDISGFYVPDAKERKKTKKNYNSLIKDFKGTIEFFTDRDTFVKEFPNVASANKPELKSQKLTIDVKVYYNWVNKNHTNICYNFFIYNNGIGIEFRSIYTP